MNQCADSNYRGIGRKLIASAMFFEPRLEIALGIEAKLRTIDQQLGQLRVSYHSSTG